MTLRYSISSLLKQQVLTITEDGGIPGSRCFLGALITPSGRSMPARLNRQRFTMIEPEKRWLLCLQTKSSASSVPELLGFKPNFRSLGPKLQPNGMKELSIS